MTEMALRVNDSAESDVLYMALELSLAKWKICFTNREGRRRRKVSVNGGDLVQLGEALRRAKEKLGLDAQAPVYSCYEAGRDGFWLHRLLRRWGVANAVVDPASIEVNRQAKRAKTDRLDAETLLSKLRQYHGGERIWKVVRVPDEAAEAGRHLHREMERLKKERVQHVARIKSLLIAEGIRLERVPVKGWVEQVRGFRRFDGRPLAQDLQGQLEREGARLDLVRTQLRKLEAEQARRVRDAGETGPLAQVRQLSRLKGIGPVASWVFVMEFFGWRRFRNGKQVGALAGLTGTPYDSGASRREQGISKAGNRRVRALALEIAWLWLRYQPHSALSRWFTERFGAAGKRHRRVGIVALARKLLVALWRYLETGLVPEGADFKAVV